MSQLGIEVQTLGNPSTESFEQRGRLSHSPTPSISSLSHFNPKSNPLTLCLPHNYLQHLHTLPTTKPLVDYKDLFPPFSGGGVGDREEVRGL